MRRTTIRLAIVAALIALASAKLAGGQPASAPTATKTTVAKPSAQTAKTGIVKTKTSPAKTTASKKKSGKKAKKTGVQAKGPKKPSPTSKVASAPTTTTKPTTPWKPNNPIAQQLSSKPTEVARARRVLPAGTDLNAATTGFRNYSQFNAAVNATESKGLDFGKLKALMTGINMDGSRTHRPTMTLSEATQTLHGTATTPPGY